MKMAFEFKKCYTEEGLEIEGLREIQPCVISDNRGSFFEAYNQKAFFDAGLNMNFVQDNQSFSEKYVIRGLHFQKTHSQGKLIRTLSGQIYDVVVDLRKDSKTFGKHYGVILGSKQQNMFYIPEGFAHGFCVLSDSATILYKCSDFYYPEDEGGIIWNDPTINIDWEKILPGIMQYKILSDKDKKYPFFNPEGDYFDSKSHWIGDKNA